MSKRLVISLVASAALMFVTVAPVKPSQARLVGFAQCAANVGAVTGEGGWAGNTMDFFAYIGLLNMPWICLGRLARSPV